MNARTLRFIAEASGYPSSHHEILSTLDVEELLRAVENENTQYLEGKTIGSLQQEIYDSLKPYVAEDQLEPSFHKLAGYRLVDEVYQVHRGKYVRWIPREGGALTKGGTVLNVRFSDSGTLVLCRNGNWFTQYRFDECLTFQKLSDDELMVLAAYNAIASIPET
jgi:hypothetical protein